MANWRRVPFAASCAVVVAVVGADAELLVGCACLCKSAARQDSDPAPTGTAQVNPSSRRARRETGPLASERPGGPVLPLGAASCGLAVNSLHSPCAPLLPVWGVGRARHTVPPPPGRLALPSPPHRHPLHARASGLAAAACRGPPTTGQLLPTPPAACSVNTRGAPRVTTVNWVGGWEKLHWLDVATVSAALAVVTLAWGCAAPNRSSEVSSSVLVRCRC